MSVLPPELDKKAYHKAVDEYSDRLYRFAIRLCRDEELAKDFVQDTFEKVWIKKEDIQAEKVKSYLFRSLYNAFVDHTRKIKPISMDGHEHGNLYSMPQPDLNEILHSALNQLSDVQRSAVLLRDYEGYNYDEIGEILNLSTSQVKVYIFRARKHLQKYIGKLEAVI